MSSFAIIDEAYSVPNQIRDIFNLRGTTAQDFFRACKLFFTNSFNNELANWRPRSLQLCHEDDMNAISLAVKICTHLKKLCFLFYNTESCQPFYQTIISESKDFFDTIKILNSNQSFLFHLSETLECMKLLKFKNIAMEMSVVPTYLVRKACKKALVKSFEYDEFLLFLSRGVVFYNVRHHYIRLGIWQFIK